jgi:ribA/ribD-fused uncharacterized protein
MKKNETAITEFQNQYRWLSNFWPCPVELEGEIYPSVENAYQAAKTLVKTQRLTFKECTAGQAKRFSKSLTLRPDWEGVKINVMRTLIMQKFAAGTELANKLLSTGDAELIEGNAWGDTFWGVCRGKGHNHLGKLLMEQRASLRYKEYEED